MSEILSYGQWTETEGSSLDGLDQIRGYSDYFRTETFADKSFKDEDVNKVDGDLFRLARSRGLLPEDDEAAQEQYTKREPTTADYERVVEDKFYNDGEGEDEVRAFLAHQRNGSLPELLDPAREAAMPFLTPEAISKARQSAVRRGEAPFASYTDEDGKLRVEVNSGFDTLTREEISSHARNNKDLVDPRMLGHIESQFSTPEENTAPRHTVFRRYDAQNMLQSSKDEDVAAIVARVTEQVTNGDVTGARETAKELDSRFRSQFSEDDIVESAIDLGKRRSNLTSPTILSTGEVLMPTKMLVNEEEHDILLDSLEVSDAQKTAAKKRRADLLESSAPKFHKLAAINDSDYMDFFEESKALGKTDGKIIEEWFSNEENYSSFSEKAEGIFQGFVEGAAGLVMYPAALLGSEDARDALISMQKAESSRQEYGNLFGENFGIGYEILKTLPAVGFDIAASVVTGGSVGAMSLAGKVGMKALLKRGLTASASATAKASLKKAVADGGAAAALKVFGNEFTQKLGKRLGSVAALAPATFNRSAGATYVSIYSTIQEQNPEMTPEQLREASLGHALVAGAITVGITSVFQGLGAAGAETWAHGAGSKLSIRQLNGIYDKITSGVAKLPDDLSRVINLASFKTFTGSLVRQSMVRATGKHTASEAVEEGLDEFANYFVTQHATGGDVNIIDALKQAGHAAVLGGAFGVMGAVRDIGVTKKTTNLQRAEVEAGVFSKLASDLEAGGDTNSAAFLRQMNSRAAERKVAVTEELNILGQEVQDNVDEMARPETVRSASVADVDAGLESTQVALDKLQAIPAASRTIEQRRDIAAYQLVIKRLSEQRVVSAENEERAAEAATDPEASETAPPTPEEVNRTLTFKIRAVQAQIASILSTPAADRTPAQRARLKSAGAEEKSHLRKLAKLEDTGSGATPQYRGPEATLPAAPPNVAPESEPSEDVEFDEEGNMIITSQRLNPLETDRLAPVTKPAATPVNLEGFAPAPAPAEIGPEARQAGQELINKLDDGVYEIYDIETDQVGRLSVDTNPDGTKNGRWIFETGEGNVGSDTSSLVPLLDDSGNVHPQAQGTRIGKRLEGVTTLRGEAGAALERAENGEPLTPEEAEAILENNLEEQLKGELDELPVDIVVGAGLPDAPDNPATAGKAKATRAAEAAKKLINEDADNKEDATSHDVAGRADQLQESISDNVEQTKSEARAEELLAGRDPATKVEVPLPKTNVAGASTLTTTLGKTVNNIVVLEGNLEGKKKGTRVEEEKKLDGLLAAIEPVEGAQTSQPDKPKTKGEEGAQTSQPDKPKTKGEKGAQDSARQTTPAEDKATPAPEPVEPVSEEEAEANKDAEESYKDTKRKAKATGKSAKKIAEEKVADTKAAYDTVTDIIIPLWDLTLNKNEQVFAGNNLVFITTAKLKPGEEFGVKGSELVVRDGKGGPVLRTIKGAKKTKRGEHTLTGFLTPEDEATFNDLLERGVVPSYNDLRNELSSSDGNYITPFLRTLRAAEAEAHPPIPHPPGVTTTGKPNPGTTAYVKFVTWVSGKTSIALSKAQLEIRLRELSSLSSIPPSKRKNFHANLQKETDELMDMEDTLDEDQRAALAWILQKEALEEAIADATTTVRETNRVRLVAKGSHTRLSPVEFESLLDMHVARHIEKMEAVLRHHYMRIRGLDINIDEATRNAFKAQQNKVNTILNNINSTDGTISNVDLGAEVGRVSMLLATMRRGVTSTSRAATPVEYAASRRAARRTSIDGRTHNHHLPVITNEKGEHSGFFDNVPATQAMFLSIGMPVRVPTSHRGKGTKRNPSIGVDSKGWVKSVYDPHTGKTVTRAGDLSTFNASPDYTPAKLKSQEFINYVLGLPPVETADVASLGKPPLGELNSEAEDDGQHIKDAIDMLNGTRGGERGHAINVNKRGKAAEEELNSEFGPRATRLRDKIDALTNPPSIQVGIHTLTKAEDITNHLGTLNEELEAAKARVEGATKTNETFERGSRNKLSTIRNKEGLTAKDKVAKFQELEAKENVKRAELTQGLRDAEADVKELEEQVLKAEQVLGDIKAAPKGVPDEPGLDISQDNTTEEVISILEEALEDLTEEWELERKNIDGQVSKELEESQTLGTTRELESSSVAGLRRAAEDANGDPTDALHYAHMLYIMEIREFGLAKAIDAEFPDIGDAGSTHDVGKVSEFIENRLSPDAVEDVKSRFKKKVPVAQALDAYAVSLVDKLKGRKRTLVKNRPDKTKVVEGSTRWHYVDKISGAVVNRPMSLNAIIKKVTSLYAKKLPDVTPRISLDAPLEEGSATQANVEAIVQALSVAAFADTTASGPSIAGTDKLSVPVLEALENSPKAMEELYTLAEDVLGVSFRGRPVDEVWDLISSHLIGNPDVRAGLSPEQKEVMRSLFGRVDKGVGNELNEAAANQDVLNGELYRKMGLSTSSLNQPGTVTEEGASRTILETLSKEGRYTTPEQRPIAKGLSDFFLRKGVTPPSIQFVRVPPADGSWVGTYQSGSQTIVINLNRTNSMGAADTILRGMLEHVLNVQYASSDPLSKQTKKIIDDLIAAHPDVTGRTTEGVVTDAGDVASIISFAMTDPEPHLEAAKRGTKPLATKISDALADLLQIPVLPADLSPVGRSDSFQVHRTRTRSEENVRPPLGLVNEVMSYVPAGVKVVETTDESGPMKVRSNRHDTIFVNEEKLADLVDGLKPKAREMVIKTIINHELSHLASISLLTDAQRRAVYLEMSKDDRAEAEARTPNSHPSVVAEEYLRMQVERTMFGASTEDTVRNILSYGTGLRGRIVSYIQNFLTNLVRLFRQGRPTPQNAAHISKIRRRLSSIKRTGIPLQPIADTDATTHLLALEDRLDNGGDRQFHSIPLFGEGSAVSETFRRIKKKTFDQQAKAILDDRKNGQNRALFVVNNFQKTLDNELARLHKKGIVVTQEQMNDAMGYSGVILSDEEVTLLSNTYDLEIDGGMDPDLALERHDARISNAERDAASLLRTKREAASAEIEAVSPQLHAIIENLRAEIDELSAEVSMSTTDARLKATIDNNMGVYLTRDYHIFNTSGWTESAMTGVNQLSNDSKIDFAALRVDAIHAVMHEYNTAGRGITPEQAEDILDSILQSFGSADGSLVSTTAAAKKNTSIFKQKSDLPEALRELMGEVKTPVLNAISTYNKLAHHMIAERTLTAMSEHLTSTGILSDKKDGEHTEPVLSSNPDNPAMAPFAGKFTDPVTAEALKAEFGPQGREALSATEEQAHVAGRIIMGVAGASITLKTLGSLGFYTRNILSNHIFFLPFQGLMPLGQLIHGRGSLQLSKGAYFESKAGNNTQKIKRLIDLGILHDDVQGTAMIEIIKKFHDNPSESVGTWNSDMRSWASGEPPSTLLQKALKIKANTAATAEWLAKANNMFDGHAKITLFEYELYVLKKARDKVGGVETDAELEEKAASKVKRTMQGHSQVIAPVKSLTGSSVGLLIAPSHDSSPKSFASCLRQGR